LLTEPIALLAGAPIGLLAGTMWGVNRARYAVIPWLVDRTVGHPLRALPDRSVEGLEPALPDLRAWLKRAPDRRRWAPVLTGIRHGWRVHLGTGWLAIDLGETVPRVEVPLDRGRFWRDVLSTGPHDRSPEGLDGDTILRRTLGDDAGGPLVTEPLFGWRRVERLLRSNPALGRAQLLDGHLVVPSLQAGVPSAQLAPQLDHLVDLAQQVATRLHAPWERLSRTHRLFSSGQVQAGNRRMAGIWKGISVQLSDRATDARPDLRINGPELSAFSTALARADRRRGRLSTALRAALRWTPLLAWDARTVHISADLPHPILPEGCVLARSQTPTQGVGHPVLDRLADYSGPAHHRSILRRPELAEPLVELLAMSPTTRVTTTHRTRVTLDLPALADADLTAVLEVLARLA